jgi:hypothetical protein
VCPACRDQIAGSEFMQELNEGHDVEPRVDYAVVSTMLDEVVTPYQSQFLKGATNIVLRDQCPLDLSEHGTIIADLVAWRWRLNAPRPPRPTDAGMKPFCVNPNA